jgi:hypothetical protein
MMKIFWSWQSDTPGKTGRHFVRDVLKEAIKELKQAQDLEEPLEREGREAVHLDHDRHGVLGSPDLAPTIFRKIEASAVFISDVTLVAEIRDAEGALVKKLINSNVTIEYGFALKALTDERVLMVQNTHFGSREDLPFDLKHKAGPIQYSLAPGATKAEIAAEAVKLRATFVGALRPYLTLGQGSQLPPEPFPETPSTNHPGMFWRPGDVLAVAGETPLARATGRADAEQVEFHLDEPAITQIFRNGEIWAISRAFVREFQGNWVVPMEALNSAYTHTIGNFLQVASENIGLQLPYTAELGAGGLKNVRLSMPRHMARWTNDISDPIFDNHTSIRKSLNSNEPGAVAALIQEFSSHLYDQVGVTV